MAVFVCDPPFSLLFYLCQIYTLSLFIHQTIYSPMTSALFLLSTKDTYDNPQEQEKEESHASFYHHQVFRRPEDPRLRRFNPDCCSFPVFQSGTWFHHPTLDNPRRPFLSSCGVPGVGGLRR